MEGDPVRQRWSVDELSHRLVRRGRRQGIPGYLGRIAGSRDKAEKGRPSIRVRTWPRLWRQSRLALSAVVVVRRAGGRYRWQDDRHRLRRDGARRGFLPGILPEDDVRGRVGL